MTPARQAESVSEPAKARPEVFLDPRTNTEMVSVVVARSKAFAEMVLAVMRERDGKDRRYLLNAKAITVPREVIEIARQRLEDQQKT